MSRSVKKDYDHVLALSAVEILRSIYIFTPGSSMKRGETELSRLWKCVSLQCKTNFGFEEVLKQYSFQMPTGCIISMGWWWCKHPSECIGFKIMFGMAHWHGAASTSSANILQYHLGRHELPTAAMQDGQSQLPEATLASQSQGFPQWDRLCYLWSCQGFLRTPLIRERLLCSQLWACHHGSSSRRLAVMLQDILDLPVHTLYCRQHISLSNI